MFTESTTFGVITKCDKSHIVTVVTFSVFPFCLFVTLQGACRRRPFHDISFFYRPTNPQGACIRRPKAHGLIFNVSLVKEFLKYLSRVACVVYFLEFAPIFVVEYVPFTERLEVFHGRDAETLGANEVELHRAPLYFEAPRVCRLSQKAQELADGLQVEVLVEVLVHLFVDPLGGDAREAGQVEKRVHCFDKVP